MGIAADPDSPGSGPVTGNLQMEGNVFGGVTAITGATISIWETDPGSTGYPAAIAAASGTQGAKMLASTTSGDGTTSINGTVLAPGAFKFSSTYSCDAASGNTSVATANSTTGGTAGPFLYLVATGGNTGAGVNENAVLVNALGSCSYLLNTVGTSSIHVTVNEATTVAAAYALGSFIYVDNTTPGSQNVYIGAPANNNATTGSCAGSGSSMVCSAAGLEHGFWNAYNLVDGLCVNGSSCASTSSPSGGGRSTIPANADAGTLANSNGYVAQDYINGIANILSACVNSASTPTTTNNVTTYTPSTNCTTLFNNADGLLAVKPMDTLTAAINMARNPNHNVTNLYGLTSASSPYATSLTGTPHDLSISIFYTTGSSTLPYPQALALDANDNVFATLSNTTSSITGSSNIGTDAGVVSFKSNGASNWLTQGLASSNLCAPAFIATDTIGNVWWSNKVGTQSACNGTNTAGDDFYAIVALSQSAGATTHTFTHTASTGSPLISGDPNGIAIDRYNNVWYDQWLSGGSSIKMVPYSAGGSTGGTYSTQVAESASTYIYLGTLRLDNSQNVWATSTVTSSYATDEAVALPNLNAATPTTTPAYTSANCVANPYCTIVPTNTGNSNYFYGLAIDSANNIWVGGDYTTTISGAFWELTQGTTSGVITSVAFPSTPTIVQSSAPRPSESQFDGAGTLFYGYTNGYLYYAPTPTASGATFKSLAPCTTDTLASGTSNCMYTGGTFPTVDAYGLQIDSTGAMWVADTGASPNGYLVQVLGAAAPAWPQLSYAKFGVEPQ